MNRLTQPLLILALGTDFLLWLLVAVGPLDGGRLRPTDLQAAPGVARAVHDLATLTPDQAAALDGKRGRFLVTMAGEGDRQKVGDVWRDVYEVLPLGDPQGILQLEPGPDVKGFVVVEAMLRVVHHPRHVAGAVDVKAFVEYRLVDAVRP